MKARIFFSLITLLLSLVFVSSGFGQTATVASWNLGGFTPIPDTRIVDLSRAIRRMNPDVMVLTEVNPSSVADDIKNSLTGYSIILPPDQNVSQKIAILFKNTVRVENVVLIPGSNANNSGLRKAVAANVKVRNFDFILIGIHPKSGRNAAERVTRTQQGRAVANFIRQRTQDSEKDVLVIGDYNMIPGADRANFLAMSPGSGSSEFLRYISSEVLTGAVTHISSCANNQPGGNTLDGFAISKAHTREYFAGSLKLITNSDTSVFAKSNGTSYNCAEYKGDVSDHFPLIAKFFVNQDDD